MQNYKRILSLAAILFVFAALSFGQTALTQITLSAAVTDATATTVTVSSATGLVVNKWGLYVDREFMVVRAINGTVISVDRGSAGTRATLHLSGATVYAGQVNFFSSYDRSGACTASNQLATPTINTVTGNIFTCSGGRWVIKSGYEFLPATACNSSVSGNSTGTNGYTTSGASVLPVVQAQTSNSGTNTHTYVCTITLPSRLIVGRSVVIEDVTFMYGVQTTGLGTQVASLSAGTINSQVVFSTITYPAAGASETASTVTPVRADSGSLTITPAVASANVATTTAGAFYSMKFTPASAIPLDSDKQLLFSVALLNTATSATVTNSPGILVHFSTGV